MPLLRSLVALGALTALAAGCQNPAGNAAPKKITALPRTLTDAERSVISTSNEFGLRLFARLDASRADSNLFVSPLSASMALGMAMNGAAGRTLDEMRTTLGFGDQSLADINGSYRSLIALLRGLDRTVDFRLANSIWYRQGFPFEAAFLQTTRDFFDARVSALDFGSAQAAPTINAWVNQSTNGKISEIVDAPIPDSVVMYLINAIYFNGSWTAQFDKSKTRPDVFHAPSGTVPITMMSRTAPTRYGETPQAEIVELPYGGDAYAMTIVLPKAGTDINATVGSLTTATWDGFTSALHDEREVVVMLPKFKLRWEALFNDALKAIGMPTAFIPDGADFTRMSPLGHHLYISKVKQKTFVDVHEEGTEAAAVTSVEISVTSVGAGPRVVRIDRPFLFAIRERLSGTILFMGKIVQPPAA